MCVGKSKVPKVATPPPAQDLKQPDNSAATIDRPNRSRVARDSTLLTGPMGVQSAPTAGKVMLLGQ